jgi:hypothetical protein
MLEKIKGIVKKGFITRFNKEDEWEENIIEFTERELIDSDAIPYYVRTSDGKFAEYYGYFHPTDYKVYIVDYQEN